MLSGLFLTTLLNKYDIIGVINYAQAEKSLPKSVETSAMYNKKTRIYEGYTFIYIEI